MIDCHTHSNFSFDGKNSPEEMAKAAVELGIKYLSFTEHLERDESIFGYGDAFCKLQLPPYVECLKALKARFADMLTIEIGAEAGYTAACATALADELNKVDLDVIINSVHAVGIYDVYDAEYFLQFNNRIGAYKAYLEKVRESLDAPYDYDIVGHIGYVCRNATYSVVGYDYTEFPELLDDILITIINKDKCLELNGRGKNAGPFFPERSILGRYYELGGRKLSYGSDAHFPAQLLMNYDKATALIKEIGFDYWTYYEKRKPKKLFI